MRFLCPINSSGVLVLMAVLGMLSVGVESVESELVVVFDMPSDSGYLYQRKRRGNE